MFQVLFKTQVRVCFKRQPGDFLSVPLFSNRDYCLADLREGFFLVWPKSTALYEFTKNLSVSPKIDML